MRIRFKKTISPIEGCYPQDLDEPVLMELTAMGDIRFHNNSIEREETAEALGFGLSPCLVIMDEWDSIFQSIVKPSIFSSDAFFGYKAIPKPIVKQLRKVAPRFKKEMNYRPPKCAKAHSEAVSRFDEGLTPLSTRGWFPTP